MLKILSKSADFSRAPASPSHHTTRHRISFWLIVVVVLDVAFVVVALELAIVACVLCVLFGIRVAR